LLLKVFTIKIDFQKPKTLNYFKLVLKKNRFNSIIGETIIWLIFSVLIFKI
jgi:hypothetical protein